MWSIDCIEKLKDMKHVVQPNRDQLLDDSCCSLKGCWSQKFKNNNPIILELGCGKGEYSVNLAKMYPDSNYIGLDIKGSRMYTGAKLAEKDNLKNVYFIRTQIEYLESIFAANTSTSQGFNLGVYSKF